MRLDRSSIIPVVLSISGLALISIAVSGGAEAQSNPTPPAGSTPTKPAAPSKAPPSKEGASTPEAGKPAPDPNVPEKEFTVMLANGSKIKCTVFPNPKWPGKIVRLDPQIPWTQVNLHSVALKSMWEIFGQQKGSFRVEDGQMVARQELGTSIVVYKLRTGGRFCVFPMRNEKTRTYADVRVWIE